MVRSIFLSFFSHLIYQVSKLKLFNARAKRFSGKQRGCTVFVNEIIRELQKNLVGKDLWR